VTSPTSPQLALTKINMCEKAVPFSFDKIGR